MDNRKLVAIPCENPSSWNPDSVKRIPLIISNKVLRKARIAKICTPLTLEDSAKIRLTIASSKRRMPTPAWNGPIPPIF